METGFVPFAEKGRKITKASLIVRLEQELEDVERQLAGISEIRTDNFYKEKEILTFEKLQTKGFLGVACEKTKLGLQITNIVKLRVAGMEDADIR